MTNYEIYNINDKRKNIFSVLIAKGDNNYISIRKETNNPFKTVGREFANLDEARNAYKDSELKANLLLIDLGEIQPERITS